MTRAYLPECARLVNLQPGPEQGCHAPVGRLCLCVLWGEGSVGSEVPWGGLHPLPEGGHSFKMDHRWPWGEHLMGN